MKNATLALTVSLICGMAFAEPAPEFLHALAVTESRNNPSARGKSGDLGLFQMTSPAWEDVNRVRGYYGLPKHPHRLALDPDISRIYAETYLRILFSRLRDEGVEVNVETAWLAWNLGFTGARRIGFKSDRAPASTRRGLERLRLHLGEGRVFR